MLNDVKFKHSYSSGYDEPKEFFTEALIESSSFDLGLGFPVLGFSSLVYKRHCKEIVLAVSFNDFSH